MAILRRSVGVLMSDGRHYWIGNPEREGKQYLGGIVGDQIINLLLAPNVGKTVELLLPDFKSRPTTLVSLKVVPDDTPREPHEVEV